MSVYKPKNSPFWHYDFQFKGRRFHGSTGQTGKTDAKRIEAAKRREIAQGPQKVEMTLDDACGVYWMHVAERQPSARTTSSQIKNLLKGIGVSVLLSEIDATVLTNFSFRRRADVSDSTVNRDLQCLRRIVKWCGENQNVAVPSITWRPLLFSEPEPRVRELSDEEDAALFQHLSDDLQPFVLFSLGTGVRLFGCRTLKWIKVNFSKQTAEVRIKGGRTLDVALTTEMIALIANQPRVSEYVFTYVCRKNGNGRRKGERYPITQDGFRKRWKEALTAAKIDDFRFHDLRHTFATRMRRAGGDLFVVQKALGHRDLTSTQRYSHVTQDDIREAMERMESRNNPEPKKKEAAK